MEYSSAGGADLGCVSRRWGAVQNDAGDATEEFWREIMAEKFREVNRAVKDTKKAASLCARDARRKRRF
jgi:hypothetical protein